MDEATSISLGDRRSKSLSQTELEGQKERFCSRAMRLAALGVIYLIHVSWPKWGVVDETKGPNRLTYLS